MTENLISGLATFIYVPSLLWLLFTPVIATRSQIENRGICAFFWLTISALVFIGTLVISFSIGGCFENCSSSSRDEYGSLVAGLLNWCYVVGASSLGKIYSNTSQNNT